MLVEGSGCDVTNRIVRPNGEVRYVRSVGFRVIDDGKLKTIVGTATDVTEQEQMTQELRRREAYLEEAQRLSHTGSFGWNVLNGEIYWSDETFRIVEYDRTIKPTLELALQRIHPDDRELVQQVIVRASEARTNLDFEHRLLMPDESVKYLRKVGRPLGDEPDRMEFVGAVTDITERKLAEKKLRRSEEFLLETQRLSHTGSWRHDVASGEVTVSPEIHRIFGSSPDEDTSNAGFWFNRIHPEDRKGAQELFERRETQKADYEADYRIVLPDGTIKHLQVIEHAVLNESGDLIEFVGTSMDVTEAKQAEEKLRQSESYLAEAQRLTHTGSWAWRVAGGGALHLSEEWYRIYGFDPEEGLSGQVSNFRPAQLENLEY